MFVISFSLEIDTDRNKVGIEIEKPKPQIIQHPQQSNIDETNK